MEYFKEIIKDFISKIVIQPMDSEIDKAKKINLYYFLGSPIILIIVCWIIFMIFSLFTENVKVPMMKGDNIYVALKKLYDKRLVAHVTAKYTEGVDSGIIYKQSPKQGSIVKRGRVISLSVSLGSMKDSLPDFTGLTLFDFNDFLNKEFPAGKIPFLVEPPVYQFYDKVEKGRIIKQEPADSIPINMVKKIKFWISNGPKMEKAKILKSYVGKRVDDIEEELAKLEIFHTYDFETVHDKSKDMIVIAQSIPEGSLVDELIEETKMLILKVNRYQEIKGKKIKGTYLLDLPKKAVPYRLEVKIKNGNNEKVIFKMKTKGGSSIPVSYNQRSLLHQGYALLLSLYCLHLQACLKRLQVVLRLQNASRL